MKVIIFKLLLVPYTNMSFIIFSTLILKLQILGSLLKNYFIKSIQCMVLYKLYLWSFKKSKNVFKWSARLSATYANTRLSVGLRPRYLILWCGVLYSFSSKPLYCYRCSRAIVIVYLFEVIVFHGTYPLIV